MLALEQNNADSIKANQLHNGCDSFMNTGEAINPIEWMCQFNHVVITYKYEDPYFHWKNA